MAQLYLGVDGGQSSTTALIADETGQVLGQGTGGPCNHVAAAEGHAKLAAAVTECLKMACAEARLDPTKIEFASACLGFSGGPEDKDIYTRELIHSRKYKITHDAEIALSGGLAGAPGIIVIAGTGSMAFGRNSRGETARAGGWGYIYGDEGGAFDLTRRALRAALAQEEGWGPATRLRAMLLEATGARSANELLHNFYADTPRSVVAGYARIVTEAALASDQVANGIIIDAAAELARYASGVHRKLFRVDEPVEVCRIGGAFRSQLLRSSFSDHIRTQLGVPVTPPRLSPVAGALMEAFRLDGHSTTLSNVSSVRD
jgi:N-acetylglucosamine kinase-like BadF-type ATPase